MLGLLAAGLTAVMIYTLVKNALVGTQLSSDDSFSETLELILPMTDTGLVDTDAWRRTLENSPALQGMVKIHLLLENHHPQEAAWRQIQASFPNVEVHSFGDKPESRASGPWMLEQIAPKMTAPVVVIGDPELIPSETAFISLGRLVLQKQKAYFVLPQTSHENPLGEAIAVMNPTLALASIFGFRKFRRNVSHPLMSLAQGWMGMPRTLFGDFDWKKIHLSSWKEALARGWDLENKTYLLAYGEKHLIRHYPKDLKAHLEGLKNFWEVSWSKGERTGLWLYLVVLFIWSFPIFFFLTHPFWSIGSFFLLIAYRLFSKIVFQESLKAVLLHPIGCGAWLWAFGVWGLENFKGRGSKKS
jgi:hypothetical protein